MAPEVAEEPSPAAPASARSAWAPVGHFFTRHRRALYEWLPIIVLLAVAAWLCKVFYQPGHDWGDDFALYIHQAKALVNGNVGEVVANNRYAIDNSGWSSFSPLVYPWGFPLMLAPVVMIWGVNYGKLKLVVIASFLGFLFCFYRLVARRTGPIPAAIIIAVMVSSVSYIGWTASVLSDYPYIFFVAITLLWFDRCRLKDLYEGDGLRDLIILGFLIGFSFSIRREGLALLGALVAAHVVLLAPRVFHYVRDLLREPAPVGPGAAAVLEEPKLSIRWSRIAVPYLAFAITVGGLQLMLPSVLFPHFAGTGSQQIQPNIIWFRDILAEQIGIKDPGVNKLELLHSWWVAAIVLGVFVGLAVLGLIVRLLRATKEDVTIAAYAVGVCYIVGTAPFHEGRYLLGITPLIAYFAYQALPTIARWVGFLVRPAMVLSAALLLWFVVANITDMKPAVDYHRVYNGTINGPTSPAALEMEQKVLDCTRGDDVIAFFRARAMSLLTDRKAIQTGNIDQVMTRADWYVMNVGSTYSQPLVTDAQAEQLGLKKVWSNAEWVLWLIPGGRADGRKPAC